MTEGKKKWSPSAAAVKYQKMKHQHELEIKILDVMAKDPEMKYYLLVVAGGAVAGFGKLLDLLSGDAEAAKSAADSTASPTPAWAWLLSPVGSVAYEALSGRMEAASKEGGIGKVIEMGGISMAGFGAMILTLKAIFGEKGLDQFMKDMPGVGSLSKLAGGL